MGSKTTLKQASQTLASTVTKFKTAQDNGTLSPEEVVELVEPIIDMAANIAELGSEIQEGVPAEENVETEDILDKPVISDTDTDDVTEDQEDEEKLELKNKISQLQARMDDMVEEKEKEKLAQKYAQLFPVPMRESKIKEFMARTGGIPILQAQVKEAESNLGGLKAIKQAQIEEGTFDLNNYEDDSQSVIVPGGKY